jgi:uncharacterized membrane protein
MDFILPGLHTINIVLTIIKECLELIGCAIILTGCLYALYYYIYHNLRKDKNSESIFREFRGITSQSIIVGLDFLIAADVIYSTVDQNLSHIFVLALIVVIRTVISVFLNKELNLKDRVRGDG